MIARLAQPTHGNDTLYGSSAADDIAALAGNDTIYAYSDHDSLSGGSGDDALFGGSGFDTAAFAGLSEGYVLTTSNGQFGVSDISPDIDGDDGNDVLNGIEQLLFNDGEIVGVTSPIILDLDGDGIETLNVSQSNAKFDLDGDGLADDTSWIGASDAFLFLDRDRNGTMSGIEEISFVDDVQDAATDLAGLVAFDSNDDGVLNQNDERFEEFGIWRDADGDGAVDAGETATLREVDIASIDLTGTAVEGVTQFGEVAIANVGRFTLTSGVRREFADAALTYFSAADNVPDLTATHYNFHRKSKKYRISVTRRNVSVMPKKARRGIDPLAGQLERTHSSPSRTAPSG